MLLQFFHQLAFTVPFLQAIAHSIAIPLAFVLIAYLQIVLGELSPKAVAMLYPERLARLFGPPSLTISRLFMPFVWLLNQSTPPIRHSVQR